MRRAILTPLISCVLTVEQKLYSGDVIFVALLLFGSCGVFDRHKHFVYDGGMVGTSGRFDVDNRRRLVLIIVVVVVAIAVAAAAFFVWQKSNDTQVDKIKNKQANAKETTSRIIGKVRTHYKLPSDEEPTVAEIQDKAKLKEQPFFDDAQQGDYLLVYRLEGLALIYREQEDILITVGSINLEGQNTSQNNSLDVDQ
jgi:type II secretory pathway pseudopilin PulG